MASRSGSVIRTAVSRCPRQAQVVSTESLHATSSNGSTTVTAHPAVSSTLQSSTELNNHIGDAINSTTATKDMSELPGPPGRWPVIGNFLTYLKTENKGKIHHVQEKYHKKFGPMFREKWGSNWQVHVADPSLMEYIYRNQGRYPQRPGIQAWSLHRKINDIPNGILTSQGEEWHRARSLLDKKLLCPTECLKFYEPLYQVTTDLVSRIEHVRDTEGQTTLAKLLPNELYKWGLECAGVLLLDRRMGCLENELNPETQGFVDGFNLVFDSSMKLIVGEKIHQKLNTKIWSQHSKAWDGILATARKYIQEKLDTIEAEKTQHSSGCPFQGSAAKPSYLEDILASGQLNLAEIFSNFSEIMIGGADTTSNSLCFMLYLIAQHPEVQSKLQQEAHDVISEIGSDANPVGKMPYLDCVIKETLRLYPLASLQCRILDSDIVLNGYKIPKNTLFVLNHYASCRDPEIFENPDGFCPERWIRDDQHRLSHHPFASMPFGYGKRTCLGKRFARLELHLAMSKILQKFHVKPIEDMEFNPVVRTILAPGDQLPVRFVNR